jgi:hypothetical protein
MSEDRHAAYRRFVAESAASQDGYLFDTPRCRFLPEPQDELSAPPGAEVVPAAGAPRVRLAGGAELDFPGFEPEQLTAAWRALPCRYAQLISALGPRAHAFVERGFSRVIFAPLAVAELERQLPALEIVRFPGSPYEVVRSYWRNMLAVRKRLDAQPPLADGAELRQLLLELHELLLTGEAGVSGRSSFYLPASPLGRKRVTPGQLYEAPGGIERRGSDVILTSGARVAVPLLGGLHYWQLLAESVSDEAALAAERQLSIDGLDYGQVIRARAEGEAQPKAWFLPPRPLKWAHFEALARELAAADAAQAAGDAAAVLGALASFHYRFVRLHPLPSANQSLAMSFVNAKLSRLFGVGIPHLLLDQLALRFELVAYQQLFARAARAWSAPFPSAAERLRHLMRLRGELDAFVSELGSAKTLLEARALLPDRAHARRLALLT